MTADPAPLLLELGAERRSDREWVVAVPVAKRGPLGVLVTAGDRTLTLRTFLMRGPDRSREEVYRRLLRKQLDTRMWRFAVDDAGDLFALADLPLERLTADLLDGALGLLAVLVDETYEGVLRTGFDVPEGTRLGPPPGAG
jgi:hypothetical protein